jgi:carbamoyl-phosphate synthase large subunit
VENRKLKKVSEGRPHVVDSIMNGEVQLIINTGPGDEPRRDGYYIRRAAIRYGIPYTTTMAGAKAVCEGIASMIEHPISVQPIQDFHNNMNL